MTYEELVETLHLIRRMIEREISEGDSGVQMLVNAQNYLIGRYC